MAKNVTRGVYMVPFSPNTINIKNKEFMRVFFASNPSYILMKIMSMA